MDDIVKGSKNAINIIKEDENLSKSLNQIKMDMAYDIIMTGYSMYRFAMNHY